MFAGVTPLEVAETIKNEIESCGELSAEEFGCLQIEAYETTQEEIDRLPEFTGW